MNGIDLKALLAEEGLHATISYCKDTPEIEIEVRDSEKKHLVTMYFPNWIMREVNLPSAIVEIYIEEIKRRARRKAEKKRV